MTNLIDNNNGTHTINIPITILNSALDIGGIELFVKPYGWTPKITTTVEENGQEVIKEIDNPQSAIEKAIEVIQNFIADVFETEFVKDKVEKERVQAVIEAKKYSGRE